MWFLHKSGKSVIPFELHLANEEEAYPADHMLAHRYFFFKCMLNTNRDTETNLSFKYF